MATIRIQGLSKAFRDGATTHTVLDGLDLEIEDGRFVALVGRSGSGKSTLLNCLAGIETPDAGTIHVDDVELTSLNDRDRTRLRRDRIGIVFQFFNLLPMLPVLENVALPALLRGGKRTEVLDRAHRLLDELGLADRASEMPDHLSGGEQQRVATARALINQPALLLADEPTGNLDATTATKTLDLLKQVNEDHGVTVLMVTHSDEAAKVAQRVAHLQEGRVEWAPEPVAEAATPESTAEETAPAETPADAPPKRKRKKGPPKGALFKSSGKPAPEPEPESEAADAAPAEAAPDVDAVIDQALESDEAAPDPPETPRDPEDGASETEPKKKKVRPSAKAAALFNKTDDDA